MTMQKATSTHIYITTLTLEMNVVSHQCELRKSFYGHTNSLTLTWFTLK